MSHHRRAILFAYVVTPTIAQPPSPLRRSARPLNDENVVYLAVGETVTQSTHVVYAKRAGYLGSTNCAVRRLKQHNRLLHGGAQRTNTNGPHAFALIVRGFPTLLDAKRFEWHWQRPDRFGLLRYKDRRHPSVCKELHRRSLLDHLQVLQLLLDMPDASELEVLCGDALRELAVPFGTPAIPNVVNSLIHVVLSMRVADS